MPSRRGAKSSTRINSTSRFSLITLEGELDETFACIISHDTEGSGTGGSVSKLYTGDFWFKTRQPLLPEIHRDVPQSLQANARIVHKNRPSPLPLISLKIHQSLIILIFHVIYYQLPIAMLCTGKAIPLQAWTGPEGSRRFRLPDFKTIDTWRR